MVIRFGQTKGYLLILALALDAHGILSGFLDKSSSGFALSFFALALFLLQTGALIIIEKKNQMDYIALFLLIIFLIIQIVKFRGMGLPLNLFAFFGCLIIYATSLFYCPSEYTTRYLSILFAICSIVFIYAFSINKTFRYGDSWSIFNFNPQHIGIWAFIFFCGALLSTDIWNRKIIKIFFFALTIILACIVFQTNTRAAEYSLIFVTIFFFFRPVKLLSKRIVGIICGFIPFLVIIVATILYVFGFHTSDMATMLNGRELIWLRDLALSLQHPFLGDYTGNIDHYPHNIFMEHVLYFGYPAAILFMLLTSGIITHHINRIYNRINYDGFLFFVGCLLIASMENNIFSVSAGGMFEFSCTFLLLMNYQPQIQTEVMSSLSGTSKTRLKSV